MKKIAYTARDLKELVDWESWLTDEVKNKLKEYDDKTQYSIDERKKSENWVEDVFDVLTDMCPTYTNRLDEFDHKNPKPHNYDKFLKWADERLEYACDDEAVHKKFNELFEDALDHFYDKYIVRKEGNIVKKRLMRRTASKEDDIANALGGLSFDKLIDVIIAINEVSGGYDHLIPHPMEELGEYDFGIDKNDTYKVLQFFKKAKDIYNQNAFDVSYPFFVIDDMQPKSCHKNSLRDFIYDSTSDLMELAEAIVRNIDSKSFRDSLPEVIKKIAM